MRIGGENTTRVSQKQTLEKLPTAEILSKVTPGCQEFRKKGDNKYEAAVKVRGGTVCKKPFLKHRPKSATQHCYDICLYRDLCGESE